MGFLKNHKLTRRRVLNRIWGGIFFIAILAGAVSSATQGGSVINAMAASLFESAKLGVEISIGLIGALALWLGLFEIAQAAGIVAFLARKSTPFLHRLMPGVPKDHPAFGSISMNVAMGMLGIDNGALPSALKAMRELETLNTTPGVATQAQQMFLMYMATSVTLIPVSIMNYRLQAGAVNPADIFLPLLITGYAGLMVGLGYMSMVLKINWLNLKSAVGLLLLMGLLGGFARVATAWPAQVLNENAALFGNVLILSVVACFIAVGLFKRGVLDVAIKPGVAVSLRGGGRALDAGLTARPDEIVLRQRLAQHDAGSLQLSRRGLLGRPFKRRRARRFRHHLLCSGSLCRRRQTQQPGPRRDRRTPGQWHEFCDGRALYKILLSVTNVSKK